MKGTIYGFMLASLMLLGTACSGPSHMVLARGDQNPDIRTVMPVNGKAALVVTRTTSFGYLIEFDTYLDRKMIGVTKGRGFFVKRDIEPGIHYLIAKAETFESAKINFEPDRVYFIHYNPRPGWWRARISMYPQDPNKTMAEMDSECKLLEYDTSDPGEDLTDEEYNEAISEYQEDVAEGLHKEYETYRGFEAR